MNLAITISNFSIGVFLILFGLLLGKIVNNVLKSFLSRFNLNLFFSKVTNLDIKLEEAISLITAFVVGLIFVVLGLNVMGIATVIINIVSGFILILIIIFVALAVKDFLPNLMAGIYILSKKSVNEGKFVKIKGIVGKIEHIDLIETKIKTLDGEFVLVPNSQFVKNAIFILEEMPNTKPKSKKKNGSKKFK
ncbi:MAG: small conductance mechanosensitive channel [Candidatus Woesearchaeota archaeon]|nr:small conductance mechanosensitive channel [Candidatus Woesearchaeota archaeon]MDN5327857.1 small conductance mechanosensitive channel [Candidatus Woesearchaeota archaeon]